MGERRTVERITDDEVAALVERVASLEAECAEIRGHVNRIEALLREHLIRCPGSDA